MNKYAGRVGPPPTLEELGDPMRPQLPPTPEAPNVPKPKHLEDPEDYKRNDPLQEVIKYVNTKWVKVLNSIQTTCYRCGAESPVVHIPVGSIIFKTRRLNRNEVDVTDAAIDAFTKVGWKFQLRRSYCPACKNLGSAG